MNNLMVIHNQLLATKFYVPTSCGMLISRPHLNTLLTESLKYPLTLISAPAGFGKTMLLSTWIQSLPANSPLVGWVSLDEEDNDPRLFWTYALSALDQQQPERFTSLLQYLQSPEIPPLMHVLRTLINLVLDSAQHFVLILDDYHLITEQQVHTTLSYLVEHLPPQLHIILATRVDPPLPLSLLRTRRQMLEVRTNQLRCTTKETQAFFYTATNVQLPDNTIQKVTVRTEGWLVGLQLLALSLQGRTNPATLLEETSGDQHYILDFLIEEVLRRQPQEIQTFLLSTSILERLTASLCDAVTQQSGSQQMLHWLEQANLFIVPLDNKRQWYRYHTLFAEALSSQLEQTHPDLVLHLHHRASLWYAKHDQTIQAIVHAFHAKEWQWAADLIESKYFPWMELTQRVDEHALVMLQRWVEQLPTDVLYSRPRLCLACAMFLWAIASQSTVRAWLEGTEAALRVLLQEQMDENILDPTHTRQTRQEQEHVLGEVLTWQAFLQSYEEDGQDALSLCQQALALLSPHNSLARLQIGCAQLWVYYCSCENDAEAAIQSNLQAISLTQPSGPSASTIACMGTIAMHMIGAGRLRAGYQLSQQAIELGEQSIGLPCSNMALPTIFQAEILREWNQLERVSSLIEESIWLCQHDPSIASLSHLLFGYQILLRISFSQGDYDAACSALWQLERIGAKMNQSYYHYFFALFATIDQVRLWLTCGKLDQAMHWTKHLNMGKRSGSPFAYEREEVAQARIFLATAQPIEALQRLKPVLQRATIGKRWGHVIEIRLLQALAHHMCQQVTQALKALAEAIRLAEPEGYIRTFVEEGLSMADLLRRLREDQCTNETTHYLDTLLAAFPQESKRYRVSPKQDKRKNR